MRNREIRTPFCFARFMHVHLLESSFKNEQDGAFEVDVFWKMDSCVGSLLSAYRCHFSTGLNWILAAVFLHFHPEILSM